MKKLIASVLTIALLAPTLILAAPSGGHGGASHGSGATFHAPVIHSNVGASRTNVTHGTMSSHTRSAPNARQAPNNSRPISRGPIRGSHQYGAWGWNHSRPWSPNGRYFGGGFWGPFALGIVLGSAFVIGFNSPGYYLFQNYGLQYAPCDSDGLVYLIGPNNSMVCAYPTANIPPGYYNIDPSTLTISPQ